MHCTCQQETPGDEPGVFSMESKMEGELTIIKTDGFVLSRKLLSPPTYQELNKAVGGYLETVPLWETFRGKPCVVFCNEEGKIHNLPFNSVATVLWYQAIGQTHDDVLVGDVVVITGDEELMAEL